MRLVVSILALSLAACATSSTTYGPNGKQAHSISCPGAANSWGSCYEKAGSICSAAGYDVVVQNGSVTPFGMANGYANASGGSVSAFNGGFASRSILVQCKT